jgi:hypothetical protein
VGLGFTPSQGGMIDNGSLTDGLYYMVSQQNTQCCITQAYHSRSRSLCNKNLASMSLIWVPFLLLLQCMFPSSLLHNNVSKFQYETCELLKHHCASCSSSINRSVEPFVLVHTNVWGLSWAVSVSSYLWFVSFINDFSQST